MANEASSTLRTCRKCKVEKSLDEFYNRKSHRGGKSARCKMCDSEQSKQWYHANRDRIRKKRREWDAANRDKVNEIARNFRARHPDRIKEDNKRRYERLKREDREALRRYRKVSKTNRRAREKAAEGSFSSSDIESMKKAQDGRCWYCSTKPETLEVEHRIPLSRGGSNDPSNLVLSCGPCNKRKMTKMPWEMDEGRLL